MTHTRSARPVGPLLITRRYVDLLRTASAACPLPR